MEKIKREITQKKREATRREYRRVYEYMCLPPRDIQVEHNGRRYVRRAWSGVGHFGWGRWMEA